MIEKIETAFLRSLAPPPLLTLRQWADRFRVLTSATSSSAGRWKTEAVPCTIGIYDAYNEPDTHTMSLMLPVQMAKTELLNNIVGYHIHLDPCPILLVQPTVKLAESWSKDRLAPMISACKPLRERVADPKSRDSSNTIDHKVFPGGHITAVGANSPVDLASRPIRNVLCDEIDKYPTSAGSEGDPLLLAEARSRRFFNRKSVRVCSPTIKGASRIEREYLKSDMRKCFVTCPHCNDAAPITWDRIVWDRHEDGRHKPETAAITCVACGAIWSERDRRKAIKGLIDAPAGGWRQTRPFLCSGCETAQTPSVWNDRGRALCSACGEHAPYEGHAGFQVSAFYHYQWTMEELIREWVTAVESGDIEAIKVYVNTRRAETFEVAGKRFEISEFESRLEDYDASTIPRGVRVLTVGCDVQDDRLEAECVGWGEGFESWGIEYRVFMGDPSSEAVWNDLRDWIAIRRYTEDQRLLYVQATCVDSGGHHTDAVYRFARKYAGARVHAIKGSSNEGQGPIWPLRANIYSGTRVNIINTVAAKDEIFARFKVEEPGPGFCHWSRFGQYPKDYLAQITAEELVVSRSAGNPKRSYKKIRAKNEALDCRVYAYAALRSLGANWLVYGLETPIAPKAQKGQTWISAPDDWLRTS